MGAGWRRNRPRCGIAAAARYSQLPKEVGMEQRKGRVVFTGNSATTFSNLLACVILSVITLGLALP